MLAENALTTIERMKLMLGLSDIDDEKVNLIVELLINKASSWICLLYTSDAADD